VSVLLPVIGFLVVSTLIVGWIAHKNRPIWLPLAVGFVARMLCALWAYVLVGMFSLDAVHYDLLGSQIASVWRHVEGATVPAIGVGKDAFPYMLGVIDFLFGNNPMLGLIVNVTAGTLLIAVVAATTKRIGGNPKAGAWITALFPPLLVWGDLLLREAITWLIMGVIVWALVRLAGRLTDWFAWGAVTVSSFALLGFRGSATLIVAGAAILALAFVQKRWWVTLAAAAAAVVVAIIAISRYRLPNIDAIRASLATARTGSFPVAPSTDPLGSLWAIVRIVPKVLLGPYPWEWLQTGLPFALDAMLWLAVLWFVFRGWKRSTNRRVLGVIILPAVALLLALAVTSGNYGTMQRLRVQSTVMILPLAAVGLRRRVIDDETADLHETVQRC
jgi:hypothetical protein